MILTRRACLALLLLVAASPAAGGAPSLEEVEKVVRERTGATLVWSPAGAASSAAQGQVDTLLKEELTAEQAVQVALLNNRSIQATLRDLGIAEAELRQAGLIKNPVVETELRFPKRPFEIVLTQDVVDLFLRPVRKRVASARLRETQLRVAHAVLGLAAEVRGSFHSLQAALQVLAMRQTIAEGGKASADLAQRQFAAGNISLLQQDNIQALYEEARLDLAQSEAETVQARERLNRLMGTWGARTEWKVGAHLPELPPSELPADELEALAVRKRFDLAATGEEVRAAEHAVPLARWSQWPTLDLGMHFEREPEGLRTSGPAVLVSIPIFDRGQAAAAGARFRLEQGLERRAALAIDIRTEVRAALARVVAARERVAYYRDVVIPRRERILAETQREYNFMLAGVYQLIQAKHQEVEARRASIEAQRDYWLARTDLERAVGGSLSGAPADPSELRE